MPGALTAALPIVAILVLMLGLRQSAARAGLVGLALALAAAHLVFGPGPRALGAGPVATSAGALAEALFIALTILWIIFPALCIHDLQRRTGAIDVLRLAMGRLSDDPRIVALLVAWFFALFIEGAAGFGTSVALAAPFLVSAGFRRVEAVAIALVGHAVGVSFGAVGTPILPQAAVTPFTGAELAAATGVYHGLLGVTMALVLMALVTRSLPPERRTGRNPWAWAVLAAALFLVPHTLIALFVGPELPTLGGALVGGAAFVALLAFARRGTARSANVPGTAGRRGELVRAAAPYLVLVVLVLLTRLVPPLQEAASGPTLAWRWGAFGASVAPLYHPGTMLLVAFLVGAAFQRASAAAVVAAARRALGQLGGVSVALVAMLGLSRVMVYAGMIDELAVTAAVAAGGAWPLVAPFVGVLGTFVTGSATASNILFSEFQAATAERLGLPALPLLGAQGFGAAVGNVICPHNVVAAGATVGLAGAEGDVLRRTLAPTLGYALLGGLLAWLVFT